MKSVITSNTFKSNLGDPEDLEGTLQSNTFRAQFGYDYGTWGNLPEPAVGGNLLSYILAPRVVLHLITNPVEIEFCAYWDSNPYVQYQPWEIQNNNANWIKCGMTSTTFFVQVKVNNVTDANTFLNFFTVTGWYKIKFIWSGTTFETYRNDVLYHTDNAFLDLNNMVGVDARIWLYRSVAGGNPICSNHKMAAWKYWKNSVLTAQYPICEESGNTAYDVSGNANHAVGQSGYNALTWDRDQDCDYYLGDKGYRLSGAVYIPSLLDQTSAADGNPLTNIPPNTEFN